MVVSWGRADDGQLGHGNAAECVTPREVTALRGINITAITCGAEYTVAHSEQQIYSWGWCAGCN